MGHGWLHPTAVLLVAGLGLAAGCGGRAPAPPTRPEPAAPAGAGPGFGGAQVPDDSVEPRLRALVDADTGPTGEALGRFYAARAYRPAWTGRDDSAASRLFQRVARASEDGLSPGRYPLPAAAVLAALRSDDPDAVAHADVTLTGLWLRFATDLARGLLVPERLDTLWTGAARAVDPLALVGAAAPAGLLVDGLARLDPPQAGFRALRDALARYRAIALLGGWAAVPGGAVLGPGARGEPVAALRRRLIATSDLAPGPADDVYDAAVESAVRWFQERHGLAADGRVGAATLAALNVPVGERIRQIELNLERWRWLPRDSASWYVLVNSVAFELQVMEQDRTAAAARVIVGRLGWPTPIVSGALTHVVLNPVWNVPRSIAVQEVVPLIRADTGYLRRAGMEVLLDSGDAARRVDAAGVDWAAVTDSTFPYRLVQAPGPTNPLGRLKLVFPNPFNVALHDTPAGQLFGASSRAMSHGCIRVDRVLDLALRLLQDDPAWSADAVARALEEPRERWIAVARPVPVYVGYWTAWVRGDGAVEFRDDAYGWDGKLAAALARVHPDFRD